PAYEILTSLEFRRVLFRSAIRARYLSDGFATPYFIQNADDLFFTVAFAMLLLAHENVPPVALFYRNTLTPPGSILWGEDSGALINDGETIIRDCHFSGNVAGTYGGVIYAGDGKPLLIENTTFSNNIAVGTNARGGAIYGSGNCDLTITDCVFFRNRV